MSIKLGDYITIEDVSSWLVTDEYLFLFYVSLLGKLPPLKKNKKKKNKGFRTCYLDYKL